MAFVHTCYRVTDAARSIAFYEALGFEKRREIPIRDEATTTFSACQAWMVPSWS